MKTLALSILILYLAGCATLGATPGFQGNSDSATEAATSSAPATIDSPFQDQNIGPRMIFPATGGAPVMGIPVGGDLFMPVTGGAPVMGIPVSPKVDTSTAGPEPVNMAAEWDLIYGPGFYVAHVVGNKLYARATLTGNMGTVMNVELGNETNTRGNTKGVAIDNHGNVYKVSVYN
jgi:hypothetical protein